MGLTVIVAISPSILTLIPIQPFLAIKQSYDCDCVFFFASHGMGCMDVNDTVHTVRLRFNLRPIHTLQL